MLTFGLSLSNGLVAVSGALLAQYQGFADVQMGIGMVVWGLASVIIGEALVGSRELGVVIAGTLMGSVLFRLLVAIALRWGLNPNDLIPQQKRRRSGSLSIGRVPASGPGNGAVPARHTDRQGREAVTDRCGNVA